jgi:hypothetical protein
VTGITVSALNGDAADDECVWYQPERFTREFELRRGEEVLARLRFPPAPAVSWGLTDRKPATAETSDGRWSLSVIRHGFLGLKGDIQVEGTSSGVLEAGYLLINGTLTISGMSDLRWAGGMARTSSDGFEDMQGSQILRLDHGDFVKKINARVSVPSRTASPRLVSLLACIGLYMRLLMNKVYR